jgi:hypothetical protein
MSRHDQRFLFFFYPGAQPPTKSISLLAYSSIND